MSGKACTSMGSTALKNVNNLSQFAICKEIYTSGLFNKVKLSPSTKLVLIGLANHYNPNKPDVFPSKKFLAEHLGISEKSVFNAIQELRNKGLIIYETKRVNRYKFTVMFFELLNITDKPCKKVDDNHVKFTCKQKKEKKNKKDFFKNSYLSEYPKKKYSHFTAKNGINYQRFKQECKRNEKSPQNDKETAIKYLKSFNPEQLKNPFIKKQVDKIKNLWGLSVM